VTDEMKFQVMLFFFNRLTTKSADSVSLKGDQIMHFRDTFIVVKKLQIVLLFFIFLLVVNIEKWKNDGQLELIIFIFFFETMVLVVAFASLFSKKSEYEDKLEVVIKNTPKSVQLMAWIFTSLYSLIFFVVAPFPSGIVFVFGVMSWCYALVGMLSHRLVLGLVDASIGQGGNRAKTKPTQILDYLSSIHFYAVHTMFARTHSLPWYVRKPIAIIIFIGWIFVMLMSGAIFDK